MPAHAARASLQEQALWDEFDRRRDVDSRNGLIEHYLPFARAMAGALFARRGPLVVDYTDYVQLATVGLIEAIDRYDIGRGVPFEAYAGQRVRGAVLNALEALSESYEQEALRRRLHADRIESLRRGPGDARRDLFAELAEVAVGFALCYMLEGSGMVAPGHEEDGGYEQEFYRGVQQREAAESLARLVAALPDQERRVIRYHYYQGLPFQEIAGLLGVTKGRTSQIHRQALMLLRQARAGDLNVSL